MKLREVLDVSPDVQQALNGMTEEELRRVAQDLRIPARGTKADLLEILTRASDPDAVVARAEARRLETRLSKLRTKQLRELGERYRVSLHGLTRKPDLVAALAGSPVASDLLMELDAQLRTESALVAPKGSDMDFARVKDLLDEAQKRFEAQRFEDSIAAAREAARLAESASKQLRRASWSYAILAAQGLLDACDPEDPGVASAMALLDRTKALYAQHRTDDESILEELVRAAQAAHAKDAERLREGLAAVRDAIHEAANLGAAVATPEEEWKRAGDLLDRGDLRAAKERLASASLSAAEAHDRRIREVHAALAAAGDAIALARNVGAGVGEAQSVLEQAGAAAGAGDYLRAGELVKRAERLAFQGQQRQIERALEIRETQTNRASSVIAGCEPIIQEAESYGLDVAEARTLLRQARDVLAKGDYLTGMTFAKNAEETAMRLEPLILEERQRRGILRPSSGLCGVCRSSRLHFYDNGWGRCLSCGSSFRWRAPLGLLEKVRGLLGT